MLTHEEREATLRGIGCASKRKEDARLIQGKGNYVDDVRLPGMLHGDFVRSPYGHARIKSIDVSKAKALPGVHAVLTANDLKPLNLHYMPTLAGDVQAVLADEKVLFAEPGGRLRHRRRPLHRGRRGRPDRGRVRGAAAAGRPVPGHAAGRADPARGHQGQADGRPRRASASQPHLHLGSRATRPRPTRRSRRPRSRSRSWSPISGSIPARSRPAPASATSTRSRARSRSRAPSRRRTWCGRSSRCSRASPRPRCT